MICFDIASVPADMSLTPKVLYQLYRPTAHRSVHERQPFQPDDAVAARNDAEVKTAPLPAVEHGFRLWTTPVPRVRSSVTRSPPVRSKSAEVSTDVKELHISPSPAAVGMGLGSPSAGSEQRGGKAECTLRFPACPIADSLLPIPVGFNVKTSGVRCSTSQAATVAPLTLAALAAPDIARLARVSREVQPRTDKGRAAVLRSMVRAAPNGRAAAYCSLTESFATCAKILGVRRFATAQAICEYMYHLGLDVRLNLAMSRVIS